MPRGGQTRQRMSRGGGNGRGNPSGDRNGHVRDAGPVIVPEEVNLGKDFFLYSNFKSLGTNHFNTILSYSTKGSRCDYRRFSGHS